MLTFARDLTLLVLAISVSLVGIAAVATMAPVGAPGAVVSVLWTCLVSIGVVRLLRLAHSHDAAASDAFLMPW
jgi:hypothetical protein